MTMNRIAIVLVEQPLVAEALAALLASAPEVSVVGTATSGGEALEALERLRPQVLVAGQDLPDLPLVQFVERAKAARREVEIVVVGRGLDDNLAVAVIRAGATAFILQDISGENFIKVITAAAGGRAVVHPKLLRMMMQRLISPPRLTSPQTALTSREREVLGEVVGGSTDKAIAQEFHVSAATVKAHVRSILRKLGARNRTEAVSRLLRMGASNGMHSLLPARRRTRVRRSNK